MAQFDRKLVKRSLLLLRAGPRSLTAHGRFLAGSATAATSAATGVVRGEAAHPSRHVDRVQRGRGRYGRPRRSVLHGLGADPAVAISAGAAHRQDVPALHSLDR